MRRYLVLLFAVGSTFVSSTVESMAQRQLVVPDEEFVAVQTLLKAGVQVNQKAERQPVGWIFFRDNPLTDAELKQLLKEMQALKKLEVLGATNCPRLTENGVNELVRGVRDFQCLESLTLSYTRTTDETLKEAKHLKGLKWLEVKGTEVTDAGLKELKGLKKLEHLFLGDTKVTDAGLKELKGLKKLRYLTLPRARVTDAGLKDLKKALPSLEIYDAKGKKIGDGS